MLWIKRPKSPVRQATKSNKTLKYIYQHTYLSSKNFSRNFLRWGNVFIRDQEKHIYTKYTAIIRGENAKQVQEYLSSLGKLFPDDFSFICRKVTITPQFLRHRLHHFHTRLISRQWCCIDAHINLENWRARLSRSKPNHFYPVVLKKSWRSVAFIFIMLKKEITNWYFIFRTSSFWLCWWVTPWPHPLGLHPHTLLLHMHLHLPHTTLHNPIM